MKITAKIFRLTVVLGCFLLAPLSGWAAQSSAVPLDKVVAIVNSSVITQNQVDETTQVLKQQLQATGQTVPSAAILRKKALDQAIGEMLQLQVAQRANIKVSDAELNAAINRIAQQNNLSLDQLKDTLQKQGINYAHYRTQIHDQMVMQQVQQGALAGKVHVSNAEVKAYLKNAPQADNQQAHYHLDDLLIPLTESATADQVAAANKQATELLKQARTGANLKQLAQDNLQHTDLQWRTAKDLPSIFSDATKLKIGEVMGPVRAPNGLHILRLLEVQGHTKPLTEADAQQLVLQQKVQEQVKKWVVELRKSAYIKIMP